MIQKNGYQENVRPDGSLWYLCDGCEKIAYLTGNEDEIIIHVRMVHGIQN